MARLDLKRIEAGMLNEDYLGKIKKGASKQYGTRQDPELVKTAMKKLPKEYKQTFTALVTYALVKLTKNEEDGKGK